MGSPALIDTAKIDALSYVLGSNQVDYHELSTKQKAALFKQLIATLSGSLQYFPHFKPAAHLGESERWNKWSYIEGPGEIEGLSGFSSNTMCTKLLLLRHDEGRHQKKVDRLLLTRKGRLVLWEALYKPRSSPERRKFWYAHTSRFQWLSDQRLGSILQSGDMAKHLIWELEKMVDDGIKEREAIFESIRQQRSSFKAIIGRVDFDTRD